MKRFFSFYHFKIIFRIKIQCSNFFLRKYPFQRVPNQVEKLQKFQGWGSKAKCPPWGWRMDIFWDYTTGLPCMMIQLFYIAKPVVRTDGLRSRDYQHFSDGQITPFSQLFSRARKARPWSSAKTSATHACPYYLLQLTFSHLLLVNVPVVPLSLASAQVIKERKKHYS